MQLFVFVLLVGLLFSVVCKPLDQDGDSVHAPRILHKHILRKRFIDPLFTLGRPGGQDVSKIRAKRSEDDCEKLSLCKLHARSSYNFFAAYELYFVNKENARRWDHRSRSAADCERRYGGDCYYKK